MNIVPLAIPDVKLITPQVFNDARGYFYESYSAEKFSQAIGHDIHFVQDNHSQSIKGVLRGLHYQLPPRAQGKLVRVTKGEIFDVAVDIRKNSPTFGQYVAALLSAENKQQLWIPEGFAHGFLTLSDMAEVLYKATAFYDKTLDRNICWNDPVIGIQWPDMEKIILSEKDEAAPLLNKAEIFE